MRTIKSTAAMIAGALTLCASAWAQSFGGSDVEAFIEVMKGSEALGEKYENAELPQTGPFRGDTMGSFDALLDEDGEMKIFRLSTAALAQMPNHPASRDYKQLVTGSGFASLAEFGEKADAILMAYMALEMDGQAAELDGLSPDMMAMMPPAMREQMAPILKMMEAVQNVPAADIDTLRPYKARMEAAFDS